MSVKFHSYHIRGHCQSFEDDQEEHANKVWFNRDGDGRKGKRNATLFGS